MLLEICVDSFESAVEAEMGGADRLELCCALSEGGLTPTSGFLSAVKKIVKIPVYCLIRCRAGDFLYSEEEVSMMVDDINQLKTREADGFVIGALDKNGMVDVRSCRRLMEAAGSLPITFHRAFDLASDWKLALEQVIDLGCTTLLTSGQSKRAEEAQTLLKELVTAAHNRITIMAGGGIEADHVTELVTLTKVSGVHASARRVRYSEMTSLLSCDDVRMGSNSSERQWSIADKEKVEAIKQKLISFY